MAQITSKSKSDIVVDEMISLIAKGRYKEGDKLPNESQFTEQFGVSRITIREAFKKLNTLGIVEIRQGNGTIVKNIGLGTLFRPLLSSIALNELGIIQLYDARLFVEVGNARLAARFRTDEEVNELQRIVDEMRENYDNSDHNMFCFNSRHFHEQVAKMSHNPILYETYCAIQCVTLNYIKHTYSFGKHEEIAYHIINKNETMAGFSMEQHIEASKKSAFGTNRFSRIEKNRLISSIKTFK